MTFKLIACDGGGIRGYITSSLIQAMNEKTKGKLLSRADGFAGTSTGGLIAVALGAGVSIEEIQNIYATKAPDIFTENKKLDDDAETAEAELAGPGGRKCAYTADGLTRIMGQYVSNKTFSDIPPNKMVAVVAAQLQDQSHSPPRWAPVTFNNRDAAYGNVRLLDACLSTSAAPAYFPPHRVTDMGFFADGGTFANNPVMNGIAVALGANLMTDPMDVQVVSFGTGLTPASIPPCSIPKPLTWGVTTWLWPFKRKGVPKMALLNLALDLSAANLTTIAHRLLGGNLVRINPVMKDNVELDDYSDIAYERMDAAIAVAKDSTQWTEAEAMVNSW